MKNGLDMEKLDIGKRLKELRENAELSGKALAEKANIAQSTISEIESGKTTPGIRILEKICRALGITPAEFFNPDTTRHKPLPADLARMVEKARRLRPEQRAVVGLIIDAFLQQNGDCAAEDRPPYKPSAD